VALRRAEYGSQWCARRRRRAQAAASFAALLALALPGSATQPADIAASAPCLTLADLRFGDKSYVRKQTQSSDAGYSAEYYAGHERPQSWGTRIELRSYPSAAGRTPLEVAAGVVTLERSGNPTLRAAPRTLNAEQTVVLLDYVTWSDATLHAGYVELDVFQFFVAAGDARQVLGYRFVRKLPIAERGREALIDELRIQGGTAVQSMLQLPLCAWTVSAPPSSV
jgi:hypothetical protein